MFKENDYKEAFAKTIKHQRGVLKISQEELASRSELHVVNISKIENAKSFLQVMSLFKISRALELNASDLIVLVEENLKNGQKKKRD